VRLDVTEAVAVNVWNGGRVEEAKPGKSRHSS